MKKYKTFKITLALKPDIALSIASKILKGTGETKTYTEHRDNQRSILSELFKTHDVLVQKPNKEEAIQRAINLLGVKDEMINVIAVEIASNDFDHRP